MIRHSVLSIAILFLAFLLTLCQGTLGQHCGSKAGFESLLSTVQLLHCARENSQANKDCSVLHHVTELAQKESKQLSSLIDRVALAVIVNDKLAKEVAAGWNAGLEGQITKHLAFLGSLTCSSGPKDDSDACRYLHESCPGLSSKQHGILLLSSHCSETIGCAPIGAQINRSGDLSMPAEMLSYVTFRLLERRTFVAKEMGRIRLSASVQSEYLVEKEIQEAHGKRLLDSEEITPVVVFATCPLRSSAYYHLFSLFLDAALTLKDHFVFHVIDTRLSSIEKASMRPSYRHELADHEAYLGLYTKRRCRPKTDDWPFRCKPLVATADRLLTAQQFSSFLLHSVLREKGIQLDSAKLSLPYPTFAESHPLLQTFIRTSDSFILVVTESEAELLDPTQDWERVKDMEINLSSLLQLSVYPLAMTKGLALNRLTKIDDSIELSNGCKKTCFIVRLPGAGFVLINEYDSMNKLETAAQEAISNDRWYHASAQMSQENLRNFSQFELPPMLTKCGHFVGKCDQTLRSHSNKGEARRLPSEPLHGKKSIDAFEEQADFNEVYNTTGVLVIDKSEELFRRFMVSLGEDKPWLVLFTMPWNPLCKAARAVWSAVDRCVKRTGLHDIQLAKLDCFEGHDFCKYLKVNTYPTVAMFRRGTQISTYSGPITYGRLCTYANLAESLFFESQSAKETRSLLDKFLPLMSRVFVYRGSNVPQSVAALVTDKPFQEAFIFELLSDAEPTAGQLWAYHQDSEPPTLQYDGNIDDAAGLEHFVAYGHHDLVFPCTWAYPTQSPNSTSSLVILFHLTTLSEHLTLLKHLAKRFIVSPRTISVCHIPLRSGFRADDLVQRLAGLSLPALVFLPADRSSVHRLPLGTLAHDSMVNEASDWVAKGLAGELTSGQPTERLADPWEPAHPVHNFVRQVYDGEPSALSSHQAGSNRPFIGDMVDVRETTGVTDGGTGVMLETAKSPPEGMTRKPIHEEL